jgi:hypothetical protein
MTSKAFQLPFAAGGAVMRVNTVRLRENTVRVRTRNRTMAANVSLSMMWLALISTLTGEPTAPVPSALTIAVHMTHGMSN